MSTIHHDISGSVSILSDEMNISGYSFVHDMSEPNCSHFSANNITDNNITETQFDLSFLQNYILIDEKTSIYHHIQNKNKLFLWEMNRKINTCPTRFGCSIIIDNGIVFYNETQCTTFILNYSQSWRHSWTGQSNINIPILSITSNKKSIFIASSPENDIQFFIYKDKNNYYIKCVTLDECVDNLRLYFIPNQGQNPSDIYLSLFPDAFNLVNYSKCLFNKISAKYNITTYYHKIVNIHGHHSRLPTIKEVDRYSVLLEQEIEKYPKSIFQDTEELNLHLCSDLFSNSSQVLGYSYNNNIVFDISLNISEYILSHTIHHEIFHYLHNRFLHKINNSEQCADNFADIMLNKFNVKHENVLDSVKQLLDILHNKYNMTTNNITNINPSPLNINIPYASKKQQCINELVPNKIFTIGNLAYKIISGIISKDTELVALESCMDQIHQNNIEQCVFVTTHPLIFASENYHDSGQHAINSIKQWITISQKIKVLKMNFVQIENLMLLDRHILQTYLPAHDTEKAQHILTDGIDVIQKYIGFLKLIPEIHNIWAQHCNHPEIKYYGYSHKHFLQGI